MKEKNKNVSEKNQKITREKTQLQESCHRDKYLGCPLHKVLETIFEVKQKRKTNGSEGARKLMTMH